MRFPIKAMNGTNGDRGLVPSLTVFGIILRFPLISSNIRAQKARMLVLLKAQILGSEAHDRAHNTADRWLLPDREMETSNTAYIENQACENSSISACLPRFVPRMGHTGQFGKA